MSAQQPPSEMLETTPSTPTTPRSRSSSEQSNSSTVVISSNLILPNTTITGGGGNATTNTPSNEPKQHSGIKVIAPSTLVQYPSSTNITTTTSTQPLTPTSSNTATPITATTASSSTAQQATPISNTATSSSTPTTPSSPSVSKQQPTPSSLSASTTLPSLTSSTSSSNAATSLTSSAAISTGGTHIEFQKAMENKKTLKKILKVSKHWSESVKSYCGNASSFSEELIKQSEQLSTMSHTKKDSHLNVALLSFGHTLKSVNSINDQMLNEVQDVFMTPLHNFVDYDFAEVAESNKRVTKAKEDYDQSLGKISSIIKKSKTGLDEGRLFLYEQELEKLKETFEGNNKDLEIKLAELAHKNETKYLKSLILFINSQYHFYNRASKLFANLKPKLDDIEKYLEEIQPPKVVEGHLLKKSKQVMGGWNKCWYVLKDGMLYCYKGKKEFHPENALNILLCSVRVPQVIQSSSPMVVVAPKEKEKEKEVAALANQDFRFEILHPRKKQPIVLQAENEEERDRWVQAIQDAISNSLNCQQIGDKSSFSRLLNASSTGLGHTHSSNTIGISGGGGIGGGSISGGGGSGQPIQTDEVNQQVLRILQKVGGNNNCADCNQADPDWASINLGIVICKVCSGVHRSLGTHISKVRSLTLDKWSPENILFMKEVGNTRFNLLFEHHIGSSSESSGITKPTPQSDRMAKEQWIRAKYKNKEFIIKSTLSIEELSKTMQKNILDGKRDVLFYIKLLAQGAEINNSSGDDGRTPLHQSILKSDDVLVPELLLQNGADITLVDPRGWTPMHYAAFFNRPRCAQLLMKRGFESVRLKCRDHLSRLAVDLASLNRSKESEKILRGEEIDTGLNMDNIENNSIPIFEPTTPLSIDFPAVHQEILSDDEDDLVVGSLDQQQELASWSEENESIGRSSFSDTNNGSNVQQEQQQQPQQQQQQLSSSPSSNSNTISTTSQTQTVNNSNGNGVPTLTTTHVISNSGSNSSGNLIQSSPYNSSSSLTSITNTTNNSSTGNISTSWVTGSQPNSTNSLGDEVSPIDAQVSELTSSTSTTTPITTTTTTEGKKSKVDKDYKNSRPKSKRRPSILGKGKNTLRLMRNKFGKKDSDSEDSESESEEAEIVSKESPTQLSQSSNSHPTPPPQSLQSDNVNNKSSSNLLSSSKDANINNNSTLSISSTSSTSSSQTQQTQIQPVPSNEPSPNLTSENKSPDNTTIIHTQSSSSLVSESDNQQQQQQPASSTDEKSPSKPSSKEGSPTPFKMFLKKLKINKKKDSNGNTVSPSNSVDKRDSSVEDIAELNDIPDNVSVGTNDDSLVSESDSSTSNHSKKSSSKKSSKKSSKPVDHQQEVINEH